MDTQNSSVVDVPDLKLARVGAKREKKRGGAGWFGGRGAASAFSGAAGGAGGAGMSLAKILTILLVSGGLSAGAWQLGNMMSGGSTTGNAAPKVFADKGGSQKYDDLSGVIKGSDRSIPNSLGYVNNDGLTDEQRAAKKAADDAAAAKAAADAQAKADADAKAKADADAKAASATPDPTAAAGDAAQGPAKPSLGGSRFGSMASSFGGGGGLSGGAGLSGGINRGFSSMGNMGNKPQGGALAAFRTPTAAASSRASSPTRGHSNAKGFAKQQLDMANGLSRTAAATGKSETASVGAATPFDNNASQGSVISGPGLGNGTQTGPADGGGSNNPSTGGSGPISGGAACANANFEPDASGNCVTTTAPPPGQDAAPYQGLLNAAMILIGIVTVLSLVALMLSGTQYLKTIALYFLGIVAALGAAIAAIGVAIATMKHGDFMIGGILGVVGGFIAYSALASWGAATTAEVLVVQPAGVLIASAVGELAAMSGKAKMNQAAMQ
ncbi:MAG TPA: hypothetical protein VN915_08995 [Elusimicrobiota bacterium]|nr:hypothetical protein [Elusimicrobiota bacterium]